MIGDTTPLGSHWARYAPQQPTVYDKVDYTGLAAQLAEELGYVEAGELDARLVLCRYTGRQIVGIAVHHGLLSDETRRIHRLRQEAGLS